MRLAALLLRKGVAVLAGQALGGFIYQDGKLSSMEFGTTASTGKPFRVQESANEIVIRPEETIDLEPGRYFIAFSIERYSPDISESESKGSVYDFPALHVAAVYGFAGCGIGKLTCNANQSAGSILLI